MQSFYRRGLFLCVCIALLLCVVRCGGGDGDGGGGGSNNPPSPPITDGDGGGGGSNNPPSPPITSVTISPKTANVSAGQTQQFSATVQGTGNFDRTVIWSVNTVPGGNATVGTISATGLYTAPSTVSSPGLVTVMATSAADSTKTDSAEVTVMPPPPPAPPQLAAGLYTGMTSQVTGCTVPAGGPRTACEIRFNIAASLDQLSPSFDLGGGVLLITSHDLCGTGQQLLSVSTPVPRITNGHWELTVQGIPGSSPTHTVIADCAGQSCAGTYSVTSPTTGPNICTSSLTSVTWSATTTGAR
jgi:Bacterial Ig-like domain (group 2)